MKNEAQYLQSRESKLTIEQIKMAYEAVEKYRKDHMVKGLFISLKYPFIQILSVLR